MSSNPPFKIESRLQTQQKISSIRLREALQQAVSLELSIPEDQEYAFSMSISNSLSDFLTNGYASKLLGFREIDLKALISNEDISKYIKKVRDRIGENEGSLKDLDNIRGVISADSADLIRNFKNPITNLTLDGDQLNLQNVVSFSTALLRAARTQIESRFKNSVTKTMDGNIMTVLMELETTDGDSFLNTILPDEIEQRTDDGRSFDIGGVNLDFGNYNGGTFGLGEKKSVPVDGDWALSSDDVEITFQYPDDHEISVTQPIARTPEEMATKQTSFMVPTPDEDSKGLSAIYGVFFDSPFSDERKMGDAKKVSLKLRLIVDRPTISANDIINRFL